MVWIGFGILWVGYGLSLWGYTLVRGYNISPKEIFFPGKSGYSGKWPPGSAGNTEIIPTGTAAGAQTTALVLANAPGVPGSSGGGTTSSSASVAAQAKAAGWSGSALSAFQHVIAAESGGNPKARNASGALGIAQALGHGQPGCGGSLGNEYGGFGLTCAEAQQANSGNAGMQLKWMVNYIKAIYGSPEAAWQHEQSAGWY